MAFKELSVYFSVDEKRRSTVSVDLTTGKYRVSTMIDTGSSFVCEFDTVESAEYYAENWVMYYE
jgi:hypothetical protein